MFTLGLKSVKTFFSFFFKAMRQRYKKRKIDDKVLVVDTPVVSLAENSMTDLKDFSQNQIIYKKMDILMGRMQNKTNGIPARTVKTCRVKVSSVFTGSDLILWIMKNMDLEDQAEALYVANIFASNGYFFPVDNWEEVNVKDDDSYYCFQTPYFWPSNIHTAENADYAVYLCKRAIQNKKRLELADYEVENLKKLQNVLSKKWEFVLLQAKAQIKVEKKRDSMERKILDRQERAFWNLHRPMPGAVITTSIDFTVLNKYDELTTLENEHV